MIERAREAYAHATAGLRAANYPRQIARLDDFRRRDEYAIIVLDALRYDYASEILPQYFSGSLECTWSAGHDTFEYGARCWGDHVYDDLTYLSGAVPLNSKADEDIFDIEHFNQLYNGWVPSETLPGLVDAWRDCWDDALGAVPPEDLTAYARDYTSSDQLVVHYGQPHAPYIGRRRLLGHTHTRDAKPNQGQPVDEPLWEAVKQRETRPRTLRAAYRANVHRACQSIAPLVEDLAETRPVVILADHGELLADYGPQYVSHPRTPYPEIRRVPWLRVDDVHHQPTAGSRGSGEDRGVAAKLEALGYA
jgi:hypothetical protein